MRGWGKIARGGAVGDLYVGIMTPRTMQERSKSVVGIDMYIVARRSGGARLCLIMLACAEDGLRMMLYDIWCPRRLMYQSHAKTELTQSVCFCGCWKERWSWITPENRLFLRQEVAHPLLTARVPPQVDIPVTLFDERLTSVEARGILKDGGLGESSLQRYR